MADIDNGVYLTYDWYGISEAVVWKSLFYFFTLSCIMLKNG